MSDYEGPAARVTKPGSKAGAAAPAGAEAPEPPAGAEKPEPPLSVVDVLWDHYWFRMVRSHYFDDVKIKIKGAGVRAQMAAAGAKSGFTKVLTPRHYRENAAAPRRTICLLKAWAVWRASRGGWARSHPGRARTLDDIINGLEAEIAAVDGRAVLQRPIFDNQKAHKWFVLWVPELVGRLTPAPFELVAPG